MNKDKILILLIDRKKELSVRFYIFQKFFLTIRKIRFCKNIRYKINHKVYKTDKQEGTKTKR